MTKRALVVGYTGIQGHAVAAKLVADGWEVLGREFRVVLDFGAGAVDHRGAYHSAGG